jgi:ABC-type glycerol-3-phosphate transport system substrate-binding protein
VLSRTLTVRCATLALSAVAVVAAACGGSSGDDAKGAGAPRAFALGFSALPRELNAEAYQEAIEFAADHGEVVLIQKTVPWASFLPGAQPDEQLAQNVAAERQIVRDHDLRLFFALDPTDGASGRDRLADCPRR